MEASARSSLFLSRPKVGALGMTQTATELPPAPCCVLVDGGMCWMVARPVFSGSRGNARTSVIGL